MAIRAVKDGSPRRAPRRPSAPSKIDADALANAEGALEPGSRPIE
ncbi:hypothetical protein AB0B39_32755 [Micromonospora sp. NPDC049114]